MDTSIFDGGEKHAKHSPNDVHVRVSITHIQAQQGCDVIGWSGRTHIPSDDVQPEKKHYITCHTDTHLQHTLTSQPTDSRTQWMNEQCTSVCVLTEQAVH